MERKMMNVEKKKYEEIVERKNKLNNEWDEIREKDEDKSDEMNYENGVK
jgi:flagellar biosynthesis/type III secretory pathway chaperone